ncbi:GAF domain-containing SpoIIE family protein phosphatase [Treponema sp.]|uniref:GAF domain-containing SpoIIE family protein phosphatase n=1 Tax=Treponema sp. TaxID=166 RepID=UPI003F029D5C
MILDDKFAYIPLFAVSVICTFLFVLFILIRKKKTARVSLIALLADLIIGIGSLVAALKEVAGEGNYFAYFSAAVSIAALILIPYCIILYTFEPKKIEKLVPHYVNVAEEKSYSEAIMKQTAQQQKLNQPDEAESRAIEISYSFSAKASEALSEKNGMNTLLDYINKTIKEEINADGGAILMVDDFEDLITVRSFDGDFPPPYKLPSDMPHKPIRIATNFKFASFPLRENIFGEIATAGKPELITKPENDARIYQNGPEDFLECGSYIMIPIKTQDSVIGVAAFARTKAHDVFTEENLKTATLITDFAATSIKSIVTVKDIIEHNDLLKEAEIASKIQDMLHPAKLPPLPGIQLGTIWNPEEGVCGDYYDVIVSRKDRVSFVMSDVAGKGINSVIVMSMLRAMIRLVVNTKKTAGTILEWVNHGIAAESFSTDHFASCALINYDPVKKTAEIATGGTTPVYYYSSEKNEIQKISTPSEPIGVDKDSQYKDILQDIKTGDILITYTDGLVEALNEEGQQYPKDSLLKIISSNAKSTGKDIANLVKSDIKKFIGNSTLHDDQSLLVIKF